MIHMIKDEERDWIEDLVQISNLFKDFYQKLFTEDTYSGNWQMSKVIYPKLDSNFGSNLSVIVNSEEIKHAMFDMSPWKALDPDDFLAGFYQKSWSYVGVNICKHITELWNNPCRIQEVKST